MHSVSTSPKRVGGLQGYFPDALNLCFKTSPGAKLSYDNESFWQVHFHANQQYIFVPGPVYMKQRPQKVTWKLPITIDIFARRDFQKRKALGSGIESKRYDSVTEDLKKTSFYDYDVILGVQVMTRCDHKQSFHDHVFPALRSRNARFAPQSAFLSRSLDVLEKGSRIFHVNFFGQKLVISTQIKKRIESWYF